MPAWQVSVGQKGEENEPNLSHSSVTRRYADSVGSTSCSDCGAGRYSTESGIKSLSSCDNCREGTASQDPARSSECDLCAMGKYVQSGHKNEEGARQRSDKALPQERGRSAALSGSPPPPLSPPLP